MRGLAPGARIRVRDADGHDRKGKFLAVSDTGLSLETGEGSTMLERSRIQRVQAASGSRRLRNALIGAGIGVAVGVTVDQTLGARLRNESNSSGRPITFLAPVGIFGGIGAARSAWRTIYRVP